ncbi:MAG: hypothetical protein KDD40_01240 [Bdellovibrionales bacterium]|nr:hypothetical protein [Bdellovibrionales bacterium]
MIVFPALFLLWSLSLKTYQFLNFKEESLHICRKNLLKYQQKNLDGIEQLHRLNPQAKVLRIKRKSAEVA